MPTTALENTAAPGAALDFGEALPSENKRLACAGALAAGVHLTLLLAIGVSSVDSRKLNAGPELSVYIESHDTGRDAEHDRAGPSDAPAAPLLAPHERLLSAIAPNHSRDTDSAPAPSLPASAAAAPPVAATPEATGAGDALADGADPAAAAVLTSTGPSDSEAPAAAPRAPEAAATLTPVQRSLLTRWVMQAAQQLENANVTQGRLTLRHEGREYLASLERRPATDDMDIERVSVEITTEENGKRLRTRLEMKRLAFSHFAQLIDRYDPDVQFHDDEIVGRFHANSRINVGYDGVVAPRFHTLVTTARDAGFKVTSADGSRSTAEIFRGGFSPAADFIPLAKKIAPAVTAAGSAGAAVRTFSRDTRISFNADGSYGWRDRDGEHTEVMSGPAYLIGARSATLSVRGTVRGKVLVFSREGIVIEGNLRYAHDPRTSAEADDYLGLVSSANIEVAPERVTGPGNLEIDAALYARGHFIVTDEDAAHGGTLFIYGSLTAGTISATEPRFATSYRFDPRFEEQRPPGFPVTNSYSVASWDSEWREAENESPGESAGSAAPPTG